MISLMEAHRNGLVLTLTAPRWVPGPGGTADELTTPDPSREAVEAAIRRLNNADYNDLYLTTSDPETYLGICGGDGRYMVGVSIQNVRHAQLLNLADLGDIEEHIMCGGQLTNFPRRHLVDLATALRAALHYLATGEAAPDLQWEWY